MWKSSFERIVGDASDNMKDNAMQRLDKTFDTQKSFNELLADGEVEKTMDEIKIISLSNKLTDNLRAKYDLPDFNIPLKNVHVIDEKKWLDTNIPFKDYSDGMYYSLEQGIAIKEDKSNLVTFERVLHEMIHFKSYNALQLIESKENSNNRILQKYRVGLAIVSRTDNEKQYFTNINEAVTELLTIELMKKNISNKLFEREVKKTDMLSIIYNDVLAENKKLPSDNENVYFIDLIKENKEEPLFSFTVHDFSYKNERIVLEELVEKLYEKNREKFNDPDEIMDLFKEGAMTGNVMKYGRLIDKTFGEGTLRKIGELGSDTNSQEEFIKSL